MVYPTGIHRTAETPEEEARGRTGEKRLVTVEESEDSVRDCTLTPNTNSDGYSGLPLDYSCN